MSRPPYRQILPSNPSPGLSSGPGGARSRSPSSIAASKGKKKRQITYSACKACSERKSKCDGTRPACNACKNRGTECYYLLAPGQTRNFALKSENERLHEELGGARDQIDKLTSLSDAEALTYLQTLRANKAPTPVSIPTYASSTSFAEISSSQPTSAIEGSFAFNSAAQSSAESIDNSGDSGDSNQSELTPISTSLCALIPKSNHIIHSVHQFLKTAVALHFYGYDNAQINELCKQVSTSIEGAGSSVLGELCAMAAIGARYSQSVTTSEAEGYYAIARALLTVVADSKPRVALKMSILLATYASINKAPVSLGLTELGLSLYHSEGMHLIRQDDGTLTSQDYVELRRTYRMLVYARNSIIVSTGLQCLSSSLLTMNSKDLLRGEGTIEDATLHEVARLSLIKADIVQTSLQNKLDDPQKLQSLLSSLHLWHAELPVPLRALHNNEQYTQSNRNTFGSYMHVLHLSANTLLYRRLMPYFLGPTARPVRDLAFNVVASEIHENGLSSARLVVPMLELLHEHQGLYHGNSWLYLFSAYISCAILLQNASCQLLENALASSSDAIMEDLVLAHTALQFQRTTSKDTMFASHFHATLGHYLQFLQSCCKESSASTLFLFPQDSFGLQSQTGFPNEPTGQQPVHQAARDLINIVCRPLRSVPGIAGTLDAAQRPLGCPEEATLGIFLDWTSEEDEVLNERIYLELARVPNAGSDWAEWGGEDVDVME